MKSSIFKNVHIGFIVFFLNACHIIEHQNIFIKNVKRNINKELSDNRNKNSKLNNSKTKKIEMAPIDLPEQKPRVQKLILKKQAVISNLDSFNVDRFKNWSETMIINKLGKSNFIKEEGILKNYQYYFKECFLDVFFINKKNEYFVSYIETRPTKLNGKINTNACHENINKILR